MRICVLTSLFVGAMLAVSCSDAKSAGGAVKENSVAEADSALVDGGYAEDLVIPEVPLAISEPEAVAGYVVIHYWDNMDFTDTARVADDAFMERHFARYLSAFPYASADDARKAVAALMKRAEADTAAYHRVMDVAERFLTSPNSSMRDEELYYLFLSAVDSSPFLDSDRRVRVRAQIEDVKKNRRGTVATDFAIVFRDGSRTSLYKEAAEGQLRMVVFYDPECEHCHEIMSHLAASELLGEAVAAGVIKVLAVYPDGDAEIWAEDDTVMPQGWLCGMSPEGEVAEKDLYTLPAMPVIYVMAPDNTVLLKDASLPELFGLIESL